VQRPEYVLCAEKSSLPVATQLESHPGSTVEALGRCEGYLKVVHGRSESGLQIFGSAAIRKLKTWSVVREGG
jgi:hypothetical protein